ncbi:MAG TPA: hypothetical protein PLA12_12370 [Candidatus Hydrogenedens sp.]|nr:hypothetical protein [Candidatus Hydrogenedens sp.]
MPERASIQNSAMTEDCRGVLILNCYELNQLYFFLPIVHGKKTMQKSAMYM